MDRFRAVTFLVLTFLIELQYSISDELSEDDVYSTCRAEVDALRQCATRSAGFTARFTTLNTYGRFGPESLGNHYAGQDHERLVTLDDGVQELTIPYSGYYVIEVAGAAGGYDGELYKPYRGRGALIRGTFHFSKGTVLRILVGQEGLNGESNLSSGGGGGTFVTDEDNSPIIIAGGGGGSFWQTKRDPLCDGTQSTTGNPGGGRGFQGGHDGQGAPSVHYKYAGGGGGGLLSRGGGWQENNGKHGGFSLIEGGHGGEGGNSNLNGGFGGGGGARSGGGGPGGGGGFSGGGSGDYYTGSCAGGGGSFNSGSDKYEQSGANNGSGYMIISREFSTSRSGGSLNIFDVAP